MITINTILPEEYESLRWNFIKQVEAVKYASYMDTKITDAQVTIGVGFNIEGNTELRRMVYEEMGLNVEEDAAYITRLNNAIENDSYHTTSEIQTALNAIMLERYNALPAEQREGVLQKFELPSDTDMQAMFNIAVKPFEAIVDKFLNLEERTNPNTPLEQMSNERIAILSLAYNALIHAKSKHRTVTPY